MFYQGAPCLRLERLSVVHRAVHLHERVMNPTGGEFQHGFHRKLFHMYAFGCGIDCSPDHSSALIEAGLYFIQAWGIY